MLGLTSWKDATNGKIQKFDVSVAKNYLSESEMTQLQRLVSTYLGIAEDMALRHIPMTMRIKKNLKKILLGRKFLGFEINRLQG